MKRTKAIETKTQAVFPLSIRRAPCGEEGERAPTGAPTGTVPRVGCAWRPRGSPRPPRNARGAVVCWLEGRGPWRPAAERRASTGRDRRADVRVAFAGPPPACSGGGAEELHEKPTQNTGSDVVG